LDIRCDQLLRGPEPFVARDNLNVVDSATPGIVISRWSVTVKGI
jgi:hypothetical protein